MAKPFRMISSIPLDSWVDAGPMPDIYRERLGETGRGVKYWRFKAEDPSLDERSEAPVVLRDGQPVTWQEGAKFPGLYAWYDARKRSVFALSETRVELDLMFTADPSAELHEHEAMLSGSGRIQAPEDLMHRFELGSVSRPGLLLPAPAAMSIPIGSLAAEELEFAVAVIDRGYRLENSVVERTTGMSDGVEFQLQVQTESGNTTLWTRAVGREELGQWIDAKVDLRSYRTQSFVLVLRTTPGIDEDPSFDYAVWSGLRFRGPATHTPDLPHVVIIDIDTLRPDRMGCYGHRRETTTRIDRWIKDRGVVYLDALAPSSWTPPSTTSIFTGMAPHQHRVEDHDAGLASGALSLASRLRAVGYETYSYAEGAFFMRKFGLDQGFDVSNARGSVERWMPALDILRSRTSERPVFLFLHTYKVHAPYKFDPRFVSSVPTDDVQFAGKEVGYENCIYPYLSGELELSDSDKVYIEALYDAGIARMDEIVGGFLEELERALDGRPALVFLTADHGEEFWEHNAMGHGHSLRGELLRVPLLVHFPDRELRRPPVSRDPVSLLDIVPTVLDYAGLKVPATLPGRSLRTPIPGPRLRVAQLRGMNQHAIQFDHWKLIRGPFTRPFWRHAPVELYDIAADPGELDNLNEERPDLVEQLDRRWREYLLTYTAAVEAPSPARPGSEELKSLRALGYVR